MVEVVHHLHQLGVMHRDIKPENFLLTTPGDDAVLKLCDFGLSAYWRAPPRAIVLSAFRCPGMACRIVRKTVLPAAVSWFGVRSVIRHPLRACLHTMVITCQLESKNSLYVHPLKLLQQLNTALTLDDASHCQI